MPGALVDAMVAGRLALRALGRRARGELESSPDLSGFRRELENALSQLPHDVALDVQWIDLPAREPPWRDSGIELAAGDAVSYFAVGRVYASRPLDIWIAPKNQIWARIGKEGPIVSSSRDSNTLVAERPGRLYFGNYFPNDWADPSGATLQDDAVYGSVDGETCIAVVRWAGSAREGLEALRKAGDPASLVSGEIERLDRGTGAPDGWHYLWHLGDAEIFRPIVAPDGTRAIGCSVRGDVGILQKDVDLALTPGTSLSWRWKVDHVPGLVREDSVPSHDYLSIAVEFDDGRDITYYWSCSLAPGTGFVCPLPNWKHREFHVVVRQGREGMGVWHAETRDLHADYAHYMGTPPRRIVRVWLIANSIFQRQPGDCAFADIRLHGDGRTLDVT
jgi:hypothetical protein